MSELDKKLNDFALDVITYSQYSGQSISESLTDVINEIPPEFTRYEIEATVEKLERQS